MTGTLHPSCPLCGLRFGSRPLLDLHIREDHRQRAHRHKPASTPLRTTKEVTAMTAAHRSPSGRIMPRPGQVIHALRRLNNELTRAFEAIIRSARAPKPRPRAQATEHRPPAQATADGSRDNAAVRAGQAA